MKNAIRNFIKCGVAGWCLEILFTSLDSLRRRQFKLIGNTSIWMFPIYGMGAFLAPLCRLLRKQSTAVRGSVYAVFIFVGEYFTGILLSKKNWCPWRYNSGWNVRNVIRLDYFPCWFFTGLLFERLIRRPAQTVK